MDQWQCVAGSVIGRSHRLVGRNNQDAWYVLRSERSIVAVVADGCSGGQHSEVGAQLAAQLVARILGDITTANQPINWRQVELGVLGQIDVLIRNLGLPYAAAVERYFLCTLVGMVMTPEQATFFACGDGMIVVNDEELRLGPFPGNQPPYLAYQLLGDHCSMNPATTRLAPVWQGPTADIDHWLIGTDGLDDLCVQRDTMRPGLEVPVGPLDQFWQQDRYFRGNPELVNRELKLIGRDWPHANPEPGLLGDDTTLVVGRRARDHTGGEVT